MTASERRLTRVTLFPDALRTITTAAAHSADGNETGGILLGSLASDGTALVRRAGGPGPVAVRTPVFFLRDLGHAQRLAAKEFKVNGSVWIGDWHTHPRSALVPSSRDLATYTDLLADPELAFSAFLALIVGPGPQGWEQPRMAGWACQDGNAARVPLHPADLTMAVLDDDRQPGPPTLQKSAQ